MAKVGYCTRWPISEASGGNWPARGPTEGMVGVPEWREAGSARNDPCSWLSQETKSCVDQLWTSSVAISKLTSAQADKRHLWEDLRNWKMIPKTLVHCCKKCKPWCAGNSPDLQHVITSVVQGIMPGFNLPTRYHWTQSWKDVCLMVSDYL